MTKVATIQLNTTDNIEVNLVKIAELVAKANDQGAKLVLLPENCSYMGKLQGDSIHVAEPLGEGRVQDFFSQLAQKYSIWVIVGSVATVQDDKVYQTSLIYNSLGEQVVHYNKIHLFDVDLPNKGESYRESDAFVAGNKCIVVDTPVGKVGLAICYDLRFPEQFRKLGQMGADIFVLPAAFTYSTGLAHWEMLLRARAVENMAYVIAAAQVGTHASGRQTWGHSMIIDAWGLVIDCLNEGEGIVYANIDLQKMIEKRRTFPALSHIVDL